MLMDAPHMKKELGRLSFLLITKIWLSRVRKLKGVGLKPEAMKRKS
jgi:hypothetical protein